MGSGVDLAAAAVDLVAQAGNTAVAAAGGAVGGMVVELVRSRLGGVDQGPEALAAVEQAPDDPDARARLRQKLTDVLTEDPAFAAYLASLLAPPKPAQPPHNVGSIHIDRSSRARGTFVVGDQAITKIRKGSPSALAALVAVVAVLALALYGLAGLIGGDDDGDGGPLWSGSGPKVTVLKDPELVKAVAPDLHSMPTGWTSRREPSVDTGDAACEILADCEEVLSIAQSSFRDQYDQSAYFAVIACTSADAAERVYAGVTKEARDNSGAKPLSVPALGQESSAFEHSKGEGQAFARVGTTVVLVAERGSNDDYEVETLEQLVRMAAARAQEAQEGRTPSATVG
ncbi:hypothetical protein ACFVU3_11630 [Streptomyces sp. NPDC058052]|uniref:hypothetical protein n=1 Tax=Streptomyces sp. NPDC058052 TaxID=3346316 RepID=UPI0036E63C3A